MESIDTGLIEDDVRLEGEDLGEGGIELKEIGGVFGGVGQADIEGALLLAKREVALAMDGESEDVRVAEEDLRGAVALMNVEVDDGGAANA